MVTKSRQLKVISATGEMGQAAGIEMRLNRFVT
jgi:hypothetical protein